jgi:hypothetical protein
LFKNFHLFVYFAIHIPLEFLFVVYGAVLKIFVIKLIKKAYVSLYYFKLAPQIYFLCLCSNCHNYYLNTFIFNDHSFAITLEDILYICGLHILDISIMDTAKDNNAFSIFTQKSVSSYPISKLKDRVKDSRVDPITRMKATLLVLIVCFVIHIGNKH